MRNNEIEITLWPKIRQRNPIIGWHWHGFDEFFFFFGHHSTCVDALLESDRSV